MSTTFLRILAVPKRHTLRSSSSSLATSSTCNHFLRLVDTIARAPILTETIVTSLFELLLQILETIMLKRQAISFMRHFPSFLSITTMSGFFASTPNLFELYKVPQDLCVLWFKNRIRCMIILCFADTPMFQLGNFVVSSSCNAFARASHILLPHMQPFPLFPHTFYMQVTPPVYQLWI